MQAGKSGARSKTLAAAESSGPIGNRPQVNNLPYTFITIR